MTTSMPKKQQRQPEQPATNGTEAAGSDFNYTFFGEIEAKSFFSNGRYFFGKFELFQIKKDFFFKY